MVPGEIPTGHVGAVTPRPGPASVPLAKLACIKEIDQILLSVLNAGRKEVHAAIERILKGWPGVTRDELWDRLRYLRNRCSQVCKGQTEWSEEHLAILRAYYAQGRAGARQGVKKLRMLRPEDIRHLSIMRCVHLCSRTRNLHLRSGKFGIRGAIAMGCLAS